MKKTLHILSTSACALLLSMNISYASSSEFEGEIDGDLRSTIVIPIIEVVASDSDGDYEGEEVSAPSALTAEDISKVVALDPRDRNGDGDVTFMERIRYKLDANHDGKLDLADFKLHIINIFDRNGDGVVDSRDAEIFLSQIGSVLTKFVDLAKFVQENLATLKESEFLALLPENVSAPFGDLLDKVVDVSGDLAEGTNIGVAYVKDIEKAVIALDNKINKLKRSGLEEEQLFTAKKEITRLLEVAGGLVDTPKNKVRIQRIYNKLRRINPS